MSLNKDKKDRSNETQISVDIPTRDKARLLAALHGKKIKVYLEELFDAELAKKGM